MESNNKFHKFYFYGMYYIFIIFIIGIVSCFINLYLGISVIAVALITFIVDNLIKDSRKKQLTNMFEQMNLNANLATRSSLVNFPLPTLIVQTDGFIEWYNEEFTKAFKSDDFFSKKIQDILNIDLTALLENSQNNLSTELLYNEHYYKIAGCVTRGNEQDKNNIVVLYFYDLTEFNNLKICYSQEKTFECLIIIDNYDELMQSTKNINQPQLQAQIYKLINEWANENNGVLVRYEKDEFYILFEHKQLDNFIKNKFEILNKIRAVNEGNTLPATISIGIGLSGENIAENDSFARAALNMALGRGGDQAVIKDDKQFSFYGGASKEYEKSTRVKARVVSFALSGLINSAENILVISHKNADIDAVGSAFGIYRMCRLNNKPANIVLDTYDITVKNMLSRFETVDEYKDIFINSTQAYAKTNQNTLLIIVDTHKPSLLENPQLLSQTERIVVIDHHRRGTEFIEKTSLIYHEPYASSTCEMITEILQYASDKLILSKSEAECLYAGIVVDTKNFTFKTGVRTFEAASFLKKQGVDTAVIKAMFQQDLSTYIAKAEIIKSARIVKDSIAISTYIGKDTDSHTLVAQAADELLNIKGIKASFVLCAVGENVSISGRSIGSINVQVILEKLGGGGHMSIAGAQLSYTSLEDAGQQLATAINEYFNEISE